MYYKLIRLQIFLLLYPMLSSGQSASFPFVEPVKQWVSYGVSGIIGPNDAFSTSRYFTNGTDTTIHGYSGYRLYYQSLCKCICPGPAGQVSYTPPYANPHLSGIIWENQNKVYTISFQSTDTIPSLLYDFNKVVGDTIYIGTTKYILNTITTEPDGRERWELKRNGPSVYWVEGRGDVSGLIPGSVLYYYQESCVSTSLTGCALPCSPIVTGTEDIIEKSQKPEIRPNPSFNVLNIHGFEGPATVKIFTPGGVQQAVFKFVSAGQALGVGHLAAGMYFIQVITDTNKENWLRWIKL